MPLSLTIKSLTHTIKPSLIHYQTPSRALLLRDGLHVLVEKCRQSFFPLVVTGSFIAYAGTIPHSESPNPGLERFSQLVLFCKLAG